MLAVSCQKTPENPPVSLTAGENSMPFTITTANADAAAWAVVKDGEITITKSGDNYHVSATNLTTSKGTSVSFEFDGPLGLVNDYRSAN